MLLPAKHNFTIWRGATFKTRLTLYADSGEFLRDLTDYTANLIIRDKPENTSILEMTTENGGIILGGVEGTIDLYIPDEDTTELDFSFGVYDLLITSPEGESDALLYGAFRVLGV